MIIRKYTDEELVLRDPNRTIPGLCVIGIAALWLFVGVPYATIQNGWITGALGIAGTAIPLIWGVLILSPCTARFDAVRQVVEIKRGFFNKNASWVIPFEEVDALYLQRSSDPDGGPPGFQSFLGTTEGDVQMSVTVYDRETADDALDAAAEFLEDEGVIVNRIREPRTWPGTQLRPVSANIPIMKMV